MTTTTTGTTYMLGKLPTQIDTRTLLLARYVDRSVLPSPPKTLDLTKGVGDWPMYSNDRIGDCTCAAAGHMIEAWTAAGKHKAVEVTDASVLDMFNKVKHVDPATGEAGAIELEVLRYWRKTGLGGHKIGAFAAVSVHDQNLVRIGANLFGGLYIGLQLPVTAQQQQVWDWTKKLSGPAQPGSWGGHAVDVVGYDDEGVTVITWGDTKKMTWAFWDHYCDEAYCLISVDFLDGKGHSPAGLDIAALNADLGLVTGA
jgi:hypothetical protein